MRDRLIAALDERGVHAVFHYVPLHDSPAGRRLGRPAGPLPISTDVAARIIRLPLWAGLRSEEVEKVIEVTQDCAQAIVQRAEPASASRPETAYGL
jgi:dTDP-4-amino-4,6-dideoxygalactose transaminase